jgi:phage tail P2-like protein
MADDLIPSSVRDARTPGYAACFADFRDVDLTKLLVNLVDNVDASALPHLAEQFNVYGRSQWQLATTEAAKRSLIKQAIPLHRRKGTPWAVKQAILALGFAEVDLIERDPTWSDLQVFVRGRAITADDAALIKDVIDEFAPARCRLHALSYGRIEYWQDDGYWGDDTYWGGNEPFILV